MESGVRERTSDAVSKEAVAPLLKSRDLGLMAQAGSYGVSYPSRYWTTGVTSMEERVVYLR